MKVINENGERDTNLRIVEVAERLFGQIGFQKTTVADIARELHMSPANVYRFFSAKAAINEAVARRLLSEVEVVVEEACKAKRPRRRATARVHRRDREEQRATFSRQPQAA